MMVNKYPEKIITDNGDLYVTGPVDTNVVHVSHYGERFETTHLSLYRDQAAVMAYELLSRCEISEDVLKLVEAEMETLKNTEGVEARKTAELVKRRENIAQTYFQLSYAKLMSQTQKLIDDHIELADKTKEVSNVG